MDNYSRVPNEAWFLIIWDVGSFLRIYGDIIEWKGRDCDIFYAQILKLWTIFQRKSIKNVHLE